jgi:hypothetical protein
MTVVSGSQPQGTDEETALLAACPLSLRTSRCVVEAGGLGMQHPHSTLACRCNADFLFAV